MSIPASRSGILPDAQRRLAGAFADDVIVEPWSLMSFIAITSACKLYDYDAHEWTTFEGTVTSATTKQDLHLRI